MLDELLTSFGMKWGVVLGASLLAAVVDIRTRRIPNVLTLPVVLAGLVFALAAGSLGGLMDSLAGCLVLALPYVLLFVFAGGGAGDAKMMGAVGAWLGVHDGIPVLGSVAATGIVFGLLNLAARRQLAPGLARVVASTYVMMVAVCSGRRGLLQLDPEQQVRVQDRRLTIPYGPAIFIGVCIGAFLVHSWSE